MTAPTHQHHVKQEPAMTTDRYESSAVAGGPSDLLAR